MSYPIEPKHERGLNVSIPTFTPSKKKTPPRPSIGTPKYPVDAEAAMSHFYKKRNMMMEGLSPYKQITDPYNGLRPPEQKIEGFRPTAGHFAYGVKQNVTPIGEILNTEDHGDAADVYDRNPESRVMNYEPRHDLSYGAPREYEIPILNQIPTLEKSRILPRTNPYNPGTNHTTQIGYSRPNLRQNKSVYANPNIYSGTDHTTQIEYSKPILRQNRSAYGNPNICPESSDNASIQYHKPHMRKNKSVHANPTIYPETTYTHDVRPQRVKKTLKNRKRLKRRVANTAPRYTYYTDYEEPIRHPYYTPTKRTNPKFSMMPTIEPIGDYVGHNINPRPQEQRSSKQVEVVPDFDIDADINTILNEDSIVHIPEKKKEQVYGQPRVYNETGVLQEVIGDLQNIRKESRQPHIMPVVASSVEGMSFIKNNNMYNMTREGKQPSVSPKNNPLSHLEGTIFNFFFEAMGIGSKKGMKQPIIMDMPIYREPEIYAEPRVIIEELDDDYIEPTIINAGMNITKQIEGPKVGKLKEATSTKQNIKAIDGNKQIDSNNTFNSLGITVE